MNMESKNGNKPKSSLIQYSSESVAQVTPSKSTPRVEYNRVEENIVEDSETKVLVVPKVTTLETHIKESFSKEFITEVYNKY